jgi:hypothetical protein
MAAVCCSQLLSSILVCLQLHAARSNGNTFYCYAVPSCCKARDNSQMVKPSDAFCQNTWCQGASCSSISPVAACSALRHSQVEKPT